MAHVYPLGRRPYIPAGCDQQQRVRDGARVELRRRIDPWDLMLVAEILVGAIVSVLALNFLF